jgi:predicted metal-dependent phosphoesterase TrpH
MPSSSGRVLVDLHAHTAASDGSDHPRALVEAAAAAGIGVLAVTDHDTVAAVAVAQATGQRLGVQVLAGCELTAHLGGRVVHLLLYGQGLLDPDLGDAVEAARRGRHERNLAIGERLQQRTGVGYQEAAAVAGDQRPVPGPLRQGAGGRGRGRRHRRGV